MLNQCTRKTFMIHQTFVRWVLCILFKFVKSLIGHLGLAIGNIRHVRWFCEHWLNVNTSPSFVSFFSLAYLSLLKPVLPWLLWCVAYTGTLGVSCQLSLLQDLLAMLTLHIYCFYVYAARYGPGGNIDDLVQHCSKSSALAMELSVSC